MLKEIFDTTYQNFYVNEDNIIVGIETPKKHWKIFKPEILEQHYIDTIARCKALNTNFDPIKVKIAKYEKMLKQLEKQ